ncbi:hypothetical protein B0T17DRAFT_8611 [Bombardia bombarda]|uniref:Secreted protein n=1 Tax=Bombardia bombarda TaxID=252184 RepID=A0AA40CDJ7_9PEZI|nr:hypothetical protein B0T17DRAFT_8611 [Bombardia bombarda]
MPAGIVAFFPTFLPSVGFCFNLKLVFPICRPAARQYGREACGSSGSVPIHMVSGVGMLNSTTDRPCVLVVVCLPRLIFCVYHSCRTLKHTHTHTHLYKCLCCQSSFAYRVVHTLTRSMPYDSKTQSTGTAGQKGGKDRFSHEHSTSNTNLMNIAF